jgi:hypothetical protein
MQEPHRFDVNQLFALFVRGFAAAGVGAASQSLFHHIAALLQISVAILP